MKPRVDWSLFRAGDDARKAFEDLCCHLAEREPAPDGSEFKRLAAPDGGTECLRRLSDGAEWGWQAKYFRDAPGPAQWTQIDRSARRALESHAGLRRFVVCAPVDLTQRGVDRWRGLVEGWKTARAIAYEYWGRHELESRLLGPDNRDLLNYYFSKEFLSQEWAERAVSIAVENAGPRYTPEQNVELPIGKGFRALCGTDEFFGRLDAAAASIRGRFSDASTRPARGAASAEFARLGMLADGIASLLEGHAARRGGKIRAEEIRKKSREAQDCIRHTVSKLSAENRKAGAKLRGRHYSGGIFDAERHDLESMCDDLDGLVSGRISEDIEIYNVKSLLVAGEAGVGKTHLFCDIAVGRTRRKQMTVLLHGSHFQDGAPQATAVGELGLACSFSELLEGLDLAGRAGGSRSLLMIDALNEGAGKDIWKPHIRGLLREMDRFPHVALAVSVRTAYEADIIPGDIAPSSLHRIEHKGFGGRTEAALAMFFDNNGIERPAVPVLTPEFSNPLFLTILCRGLKNKNCARLPDSLDGTAAVYDFFVDSVNDRLSDGGSLGIPREFRIVHRAVDALAGRLIVGNRESLEYTEAYRLLSRLDPDLKNLDRLLDALISEGVLGRYSAMSEAGTRAGRVRFAYERMSDSLIVKSLLDAADSASEATAMIRADGPLAAYVDDPVRHRGLVDALSAQIPEKFGMELLEVAPDADQEALTASFIDSLLWRSPRSIGGAALRLADDLIRRRPHQDRMLRTLLTHAANPDSPLNADYLHRRLLNLEMGDRDRCLAIFLHEDYSHERHSIVARHIGWAGKEGQKFGDKTVRLAGLTLGWFLTASNRRVRDRSTKALVSMFAGREGLLVDVMSEFRACDDPYVAERLFCAAYGCAMRSRSDGGLEKLAEYAYDAVFKSGSPPPDVMLRDYARGTILLAARRGIDLGIDLGACSPPHDSEWIADFPSESDIKALEETHQAGGLGRGGASSIFGSLDSMGDFYRYVIGEGSHGHPWINARLPGDKATWVDAYYAFDRSVTPAQKKLWASLASLLSDQVRADTAVVDPRSNELAPAGPRYDNMLKGLVRKFEPLLSPEQASIFRGRILPYIEYSLRPSSRKYWLDTMQLARWIAGRVFELGWTADRFESHDAKLGSRPAPLNGAERMGKKYQWIAYHELLARLCDNFEFSDPDLIGSASIYESTSQLLSKRDIDPSMLYPAAAARGARSGPCSGGRPGAIRGRWDVAPDDAWLKDASDLPDFGKILTVDGGAGWLALYMFYSADYPPVRGRAARPYPHRRVVLQAKSAIIPGKNEADLLKIIRKGRIASLRFPGPEVGEGVFLGELYWADHFLNDHEGAPPPDADIRSAEPDDHVDAYRTTYKYHAEISDHDFSPNGGATLLAPSAFLGRGMKLASMCDGTFSVASGACIACDAARTETSPHMLLFRQDMLARFLESNGCVLFWQAAARKYVTRDNGSAGGGSFGHLAVDMVYRMRGDGAPELVAECRA